MGMSPVVPEGKILKLGLSICQSQRRIDAKDAPKF